MADWMIAHFHVTRAEYILLGVCLLMSLAAAWTDTRTHTIPNVITYPGMAVGALLTLLTGTDPLFKIVLFMVWFFVGPFLFGEGDAKLMMAASFLTPPFLHLICFVLSQVFLVLSALALFGYRRLHRKEQRNSEAEPEEGQESHRQTKYALPLGPCYAASVLCVMAALYGSGMVAAKW